VFERDGAVYIKTDEDTLKANRRTLNLKCSSVSEDKVLVIGGGSGTLGAIEGLRGGGYTGQITVISKEGYQPIDRTKLSKALLADVSKAAWRQKEFYKDASIDILQDEAQSVDFSSKKVTAKSGKTYEYSKLVLATGGTPNWLPIDGLKGDLGNVFLLRTLPDTQNILKAVGDNGKKIVVIGSSFIGMEVGNCLASMKNDVTIIGMEEGRSPYLSLTHLLIVLQSQWSALWAKRSARFSVVFSRRMVSSSGWALVWKRRHHRAVIHPRSAQCISRMAPRLKPISSSKV
jgi:uncharacterized NAD(P)/FAD-binding protein YdhS